MIARVHKRGTNVAGLLRYLFGPGRAEEHDNPRLVAAWPGAGPLAPLQPPLTDRGRHDVRRLADLLEQPVRAVARPPKTFVWHTSMRLAPEDRERSLSDPTWGHMATEMLAAAGLARHGDLGGLRFVVVRHNDDHVHIVATLVREDGRIEWARNDYPRVVSATFDVARRYGLLRMVPPADRTAARRPGPRETHRAHRLGHARPPREELRARVRLAAAASGTEEEFFTRLRDAHVMVKLRESHQNPGEITGYAVALPPNDPAREAVYFSGGKLAPDLSLPRLRARWAAPTAAGASGTSRRPGHGYGPDESRLGVGRSPFGALWSHAEERMAAMRHAAVAAHLAAEQMRNPATDAHAAQAAAEAAADSMHLLADSIEDGDALRRAAETFDRAARSGIQHPKAIAGMGAHQLRRTVRQLAKTTRDGADRETYLLLRLLLELAALADALATIRSAQQRLHQAEAASAAASVLRAEATTTTARPQPSVAFAASRVGEVRRKPYSTVGRRA